MDMGLYVCGKRSATSLGPACITQPDISSRKYSCVQEKRLLKGSREIRKSRMEKKRRLKTLEEGGNIEVTKEGNRGMDETDKLRCKERKRKEIKVETLK